MTTLLKPAISLIVVSYFVGILFLNYLTDEIQCNLERFILKSTIRGDFILRPQELFHFCLSLEKYKIKHLFY